MGKLFKQTILFYFTGVVLFVVMNVAFGRSFTRLISNWSLWIWCALFLLAGLFTGYVIRVFAGKPRSLKLNMIGLLVATVAMLALSFNFLYRDWRHERNFGNTEENHAHFRFPNGGYEREERIAFDSLEHLMGDPNSFLITGGSLKGHDTVINGSANTIYYIVFRYTQKNAPGTYQSKFAVINSHAYLLYHERPLNGADYRLIEKNTQKVIDKAREAAQYAPDSLKQVIDENFGELLYQ